jgi:hypothetical protein
MTGTGTAITVIQAAQTAREQFIAIAMLWDFSVRLANVVNGVSRRGWHP